MIITLLASLLVAYIINPVFAASFMRHYKSSSAKNKQWPRWLKGLSIVTLLVAALGYLLGYNGLSNLIIVLFLLVLIHHYVLRTWIFNFQEKLWPRFRNWYGRKLFWSIEHPKTILSSTILLFVLSFILLGVRKPKVEFFPISDPNFIYTYIQLPVGTDTKVTDNVAKEVEARIKKYLHKTQL